jgi:hypothetical protein
MIEITDKNLLKKINDNFYRVEDFIEMCKIYLDALEEGRLACIIKSVSKSGMSRKLQFISCESTLSKKPEYFYVNYCSLLSVFGYKRKDNCNIVTGCGMDMVFATNYNVVGNLYSLGFIDKDKQKTLEQKRVNCL